LGQSVKKEVRLTPLGTRCLQFLQEGKRTSRREGTILYMLEKRPGAPSKKGGALGRGVTSEVDAGKAERGMGGK